MISLGVVILQFFTLFNSKKSPKVESLFSDALNALLNGDKRKAISLLQQVVKKDTNHVRAYLQLGNILRNVTKGRVRNSRVRNSRISHQFSQQDYQSND